MRPFRCVLKAVLAVVASLALLGLTASFAFAAVTYSALPAHAKVWKADPGIGATITQAPARVTVFTLENIDPDPAKSNLLVYGPSADATDTLISQGNAQVALSDPKEMSITIKPNSGHTNGVYVVSWKTVSADDGDAADGTFTFTVNPNGANTNSIPATSGNNTTTSGSTPIWVPLVAALVALLIGLGAGLGLGRRKPMPSSFASLRATISQATREEEATKPPEMG